VQSASWLTLLGLHFAPDRGPKSWMRTVGIRDKLGKLV